MGIARDCGGLFLLQPVVSDADLSVGELRVMKGRELMAEGGAMEVRPGEDLREISLI